MDALSGGSAPYNRDAKAECPDTTTLRTLLYLLSQIFYERLQDLAHHFLNKLLDMGNKIFCRTCFFGGGIQN